MKNNILFLSLALLLVPAYMVAMETDEAATTPVSTETSPWGPLTPRAAAHRGSAPAAAALPARDALKTAQAGASKRAADLGHLTTKLVGRLHGDQRLVRAGVVTGGLYGLAARFATGRLAQVTPPSEAGQFAAAALALGAGAWATGLTIDGKNPTVARICTYSGATLITVATVKMALNTEVATKFFGQVLGK